jgi:glycosyltransferase involved in cell wall biosynthesis
MHIACPTGSAIAEAVREAGLPVREMPMRGDADVGLVSRLAPRHARSAADLLHLHSRRGCDTWGALSGRLQGLPVVLSRRVDNPESRWWAALKYRLPDRVVTISQGIREVLRAEGVPETKLTCVPSAVDTAQYRPGREELPWFRAEFGLDEGALTIGMAAQFIERKGHATLLDALPAVFERHPQVRVLLFGQGPLWSAMSSRIEGDEVLREHVQLVGFRRDLHRVLPCLDVLAHPAHMEGLGVALLQAAACGVPIVGGRRGGIPEIIRPGVTGELIEPGDAAGWRRL